MPALEDRTDRSINGQLFKRKRSEIVGQKFLLGFSDWLVDLTALQARNRFACCDIRLVLKPFGIFVFPDAQHFGKNLCNQRIGFELPKGS